MCENKRKTDDDNLQDYSADDLERLEEDHLWATLSESDPEILFELINKHPRKLVESD